MAEPPSHCAICGESAGAPEDVLRMPRFILDEEDPLWRFSDAAMHRNCFLLWEHRRAFISRFNTMARDYFFEGGKYYHMTGEGEIEVRKAVSGEQGRGEA